MDKIYPSSSKVLPSCGRIEVKSLSKEAAQEVIAEGGVVVVVFYADLCQR